jgi:hypothetical protein
VNRNLLAHAIVTYFDLFTTSTRPVSITHAIGTIRSLAPSCHLRDDELEELVVSEALRLDLSVELDRVRAA